MGRGRGKGKQQPAIAAREDTASGEDKKLPMRRRGRPQKSIIDEIGEEDEVEKIGGGEDENGVEAKSLVLSKSTKNQAAVESGRKRNRPSQIKESVDSLIEENAIGVKTKNTVLIKSVGYRHNGSRRKNKPRRAAEVGVECK